MILSRLAVRHNHGAMKRGKGYTGNALTGNKDVPKFNLYTCRAECNLQNVCTGFIELYEWAG